MGTIQLNNVEDVREFAKKVQKKNRYFSVNFDNIGKSKNTIEFRLANGTLDADTWIENINLFGGIIKTAEKISKIQEESLEEQTDKEKRILNCLEKTKDNSISQEEKLEALLEMVISEKDRDIYRARYRVNDKLLEENIRMKLIIRNNLAKYPIDIRKRLKKELLEEEGITGQDYQKTEQWILKYLSRENNFLYFN